MARIYLSSTYRDLREHREAVYRALRQMRHDVISMEDYTAASRPPLEKCLEDVAECDVYVGIFAWRSGYKPPGEERSITELEFRQAVSTGKECLIFLLESDAPWPPKMMDEDRSEIEALRNELSRDYLIDFFTSPEELATNVSVAVANTAGTGAIPVQEEEADPETLRFFVRSLKRMTDELGSQIKLYSASSVALVAVGGGILAVGLAMQATTFGVGGALIGSATIFPINTMLHARRKKAVLDGYHHELQQEPPADEAVSAIRRFLGTQLKGGAFA